MTTKEITSREYQEGRDSSLAIVSLVAAIGGWSFVPVIGGVIAIITGHLAKNEIRESEGRLRGDGLATAGLVIGYACVGFFAVILMTVIAGAFFLGIFDLAF